MKLAAFALAALSLAAGRASAAAVGAPPSERIAIDARGPVVQVEITRTLRPEPSEVGPGHGSEALLDLALPDGSELVALELRDGTRWRSVDPVSVAAPNPAVVYRAEENARGVTPVYAPHDDGATHRLQVLRSAGHESGLFTVRYRFAALPTAAAGRLLVRFPASPERLPPAADVSLKLRGADDAEIAGVRSDVPPSGGTASGRVSTRAAWEVAWTPRDPARDAGPLEARLALAPLGPMRTAVAFLARHRPELSSEPPGSVLFLVDRSRSVGLPGLSAERDLVRALIEALPPTTRFDALFFARATRRLFPMSRPATREAIEGFETEMVPDRLQNGTDLPGALRDAGALVRREATTFGPRALLVLVTDGAIGDDADGPALDRALGPTPGLDLGFAALTIRSVDDDPPGARARDALHEAAALRGGIAREVRVNEIGDAVPALLADLRQGGDLGPIRLVSDGIERRLGASLAPGGAIAGVIALPGPPPRAIRLEALDRGRSVSVAPTSQRLGPEWLRPWIEPGSQPRFLSAPALVALLEPIWSPDDDRPVSPPVKGSMDRMVVRNVLSLAYMPRARACYLNRTAATPALRDLAGKVRLAIDLVRGEVDRATIESSTLANPDIERCLQESAFEIEVPRAARSDAPVTAVLNMVFRPRTSDKKADVDLGAVGDQIDLVIEEMQRREAGAKPPTTPPGQP